MMLHEYQSKILLNKYGLLIPKGILIKNIRDAKKAIKILRTNHIIIKAQVNSNKRYIYWD